MFTSHPHRDAFGIHDMHQSAKTLIFVAAAAASVAVAAGTYYSNKPADIADFSDVGDKFYPQFEDPSTATGLRVAAYNETSGKTEVFKVENKDGLWQIPSHHDYPADGKEQLSKTAASMIGVMREALVERSKTAQKRYDVLDPLDSELSGTEGRGDRITLYQGDDVLVDFIVGKKVENSSSLYYVRRADEDRIYTADLGNFRVSTKFADWIKKDILEVEQNNVRELVISRYYVDEAQGKVVQEGQIEITRETAEAPWNIKGLKPETEKVKTAEIGTMLRSLEDLKIVGVRRKPESLIAGLKSKDGAISIDPFIARDLQQKGVFISKGGEFVYNEGKVNVGTQDGVLYELGFGEEFSGTDVDIEVGSQKSPEEEARELEKSTAAEAKTDTKSAEAKSGNTKPEEEKSAEEKSSEEPAKEGQKKSRYLFVTVYFDKTLLGPAPTPPVAPQKPVASENKTAAKKETDQKDADQKDADKKGDDGTAPADAEKPADAAAKTDQKEPAAEEGKKPAETKPDPEKAYEEAIKEYELQKEVYETQQKSYEDRIKAGEKRVADLNSRFADWYYVISEDVFDKLKLKREDLVEPVTAEKPADTPETKPAETPAKSEASDQPEAPAQPAAKDEAQETGKPAAMEKPATTQTPGESPEKPAEKSADKPAEKPADAPPGEQPPAAEKPAPAETQSDASPTEQQPAAN